MERVYETVGNISGVNWAVIIGALFLAWKTIGQGKPLGEILAMLLNVLAPKTETTPLVSNTAESETLRRENRLRAYLICREALKADADATKTLDALVPKIVEGGQAQ